MSKVIKVKSPRSLYLFIYLFISLKSGPQSYFWPSLIESAASFKFRLLFLHRGNFSRPILPRYQEQMSLFEDYSIDEAGAPRFLHKLIALPALEARLVADRRITELH